MKSFSIYYEKFTKLVYKKYAFLPVPRNLPKATTLLFIFKSPLQKRTTWAGVE